MSLLCLALMALSGAKALSLHAGDEPAVVSLPIQRRKDVNSDRIQGRGSTVSLPFDVQHGTLHVRGRNFYNLGKGTIQLGAPFDVSNSSTYTSTGSEINTTTDETGKLFTDILINDMLTIGSTTLDTNFLVDYAAIADNILGLGYSLNESYTSLPQALVKSGQINSAAYSLWADDLRDNGTVLFGGVNSAKHTGELHTMSIPAADLPAVLVTDVYVQGNSSTSVNATTSGLPAYMILDSFAFFTYLPNAVVEQIYRDLNVSFGQNGLSIGETADCSVKNQLQHHLHLR